MSDKRGAETLERAINLVHDLDSIEGYLKRGMPERSVLRAFSVMLRRLFDQQRELKRISEVRLPELAIMAPNFTAFHQRGSNELLCFIGGDGEAFGMSIIAASLGFGNKSTDPEGFDPHLREQMSIKEFLNHKVVFWRGTWFSRREVIEFVANKLGAAHTGRISNNKDRKLKDLTQHGFIDLSDATVNISMSAPSTEFKDGPLRLDKNQLDFLLFEISCYLECIINSPDMKTLRGIIEAEFAVAG